MIVNVGAGSRKNRFPDKPNEDAYAVHLDRHSAVLVIADGVTRSRTATGAYPQRSGAAVAAELVAQTIVRTLAGGGDDPDLRTAFVRANRAVDEANRRDGVWERLDYGEHDLWGAVATALVIRPGLARWGHIGDSVALHLPAAGGMQVVTPDQVAGAARHLAAQPLDQLSAAGGRERYARQRLRNRPNVPDSYGVLTGEPAAESYILTGEFPIDAGDRLVLCTDGLGSLRSNPGGSSGWQNLEPWLRDDRNGVAIEHLLDAVERADERRRERSDDKTVIVAMLGEG
jgi:serine/threonine protein phosphatase PrpC